MPDLTLTSREHKSIKSQVEPDDRSITNHTMQPKVFIVSDARW